MKICLARSVGCVRRWSKFSAAGVEQAARAAGQTTEEPGIFDYALIHTDAIAWLEARISAMRSSLYTPYPVLIGFFPRARYTARLAARTSLCAMNAGPMLTPPKTRCRASRSPGRWTGRSNRTTSGFADCRSCDRRSSRGARREQGAAFAMGAGGSPRESSMPFTRRWSGVRGPRPRRTLRRHRWSRTR
jgi:hypothetical protein